MEWFDKVFKKVVIEEKFREIERYIYLKREREEGREWERELVGGKLF